MISAYPLISAIRSVIGKDNAVLHEPEFGGSESQYLQKCLESTFVSTVGEFVGQFERALQDFTGARHAVAVVNGTVALQVALAMAGVRPGDEVLMPALTFVGTANAVHHAGAVAHFVDSGESTLGLDPYALKTYLSDIAASSSNGCVNKITGRSIAAVVPVHVYGHPVDMQALQAVCKSFGLPIVEDAAESLGSAIGGRHTGTFGQIGVLSFNGNKVITSGGGGALLTDDESLARRMKHLTTTAKKAHPWLFDHDAIGWNFRLPNINAALGCAQMERLPLFLDAKRRLASRYAAAVDELEGVEFVFEPSGCTSNYWLSTLRITNASLSDRNEIITNLNAAGIGVRPAWTLMHRLPMYAANPRAPLPVAERLEREIVNLPSGYGIARSV